MKSETDLEMSQTESTLGLKAAKPPESSISLDCSKELLQQSPQNDPLARLRDPIERARLLEQERRRAERVPIRKGSRPLGVAKKPRFCPACSVLTVHLLDGDRWTCTDCARLEKSALETPKISDSGPTRNHSEGRLSPPPYCGRMTAVGVDPASGTAIYRRMWCNTYGCPRCGPRRYRRARKAITAGAEQWGLTYFWTLTLDPKKLPPGDVKAQVKYIRDCWRKLRVYLQRRYGESVAFIAVVELHKSGIPHLHVLLGEWIEHAWIKGAWSAVGGGHIVWVEPVTIRRVAAYLSKYITKERLNHLPPSVRRFSASRGIRMFAKAVRSEERHWFVSRLPIDILHANAEAVSEKTYWTDTDGAQSLLSFVAEVLILAHHFSSRFRVRNLA
jgi:ribosomal protein S27AE